MVGGGYPIQSWLGGGHTPSSYGVGGYPIQSWWGSTPSSHGGGYPIQSWWGYHIPGLDGGGTQGTPTIQTCPEGGTLGTSHHPDLTIGCTLGTPPPSRPGMGYPPPPMVNRQTFPSINITFPRTTYAGGKNTL